MDLKSFPLNPRYTSFENDPYHDFFVPCFANSNFYSRYGGFFSSKNLALCAEGIQEFFKNNGKIKLALTPTFTKKDVEAIREGLLKKEQKIEDLWIKELDTIKDKFQKDHIRALSWLLAQDPPLLEIKIVVFEDELGNPLDEETIRDRGLAELSVGIFHDESGNAVSFNGIIKPGLHDEEEFIDITVHKNWIHKEHVNADFQKFVSYWEKSDLIDDEKTTDYNIIELPSAIRKKLLEMKPASIEQLELRKVPKLRTHQIEAKNSWIRHGYRGIFEMATGTGKTFTAIGCIKELQKKNKSLFVVVTCPTQNLVIQWSRELEKWDYKSTNTLKGKSDWKSKIQKIVNDQKFGISSENEVSIIITTYDTFSSPDFIKEISKVVMNLFLVADEVHSAGAPSFQLALLEKYEYRLGLSATPERYFDDEGTRQLLQFFKPKIVCENCNIHNSIVYRMDLHDAITKNLLSPYYYFPHYVELTPNELSEYKIITKKISIEMNKKLEERNEELLIILFNKRANIIKNARNKLQEFEILINQNQDLRYCLIYCAPSTGQDLFDQARKAQAILNKIPIPNNIIKSSLTNLKEREKILDQLESGSLNCVIAINILDEGIDIPPLKNAIMLASTGNPRQFIQRRGRILRRWGGKYPDGTSKEYATIHDIFVIPYLNRPIDPDLVSIERKIVMKELERHSEMSEISLNPDYGKKQIERIKLHYGIV